MVVGTTRTRPRSRIFVGGCSVRISTKPRSAATDASISASSASSAEGEPFTIDREEVVRAPVVQVVGWQLLGVEEGREAPARQLGPHPQPGGGEGALPHVREDPTPGDTHRAWPLAAVDLDRRSQLRPDRAHGLGAQDDLVGTSWARPSTMVTDTSPTTGWRSKAATGMPATDTSP